VAYSSGVSGGACACPEPLLWVDGSGKCDCNENSALVQFSTSYTCVDCLVNVLGNKTKVSSSACGCATGFAWMAAEGKCGCADPLTVLNSDGTACICDHSIAISANGGCLRCSTIAGTTGALTSVTVLLLSLLVVLFAAVNLLWLF
jgi:hypothetical protein